RSIVSSSVHSFGPRGPVNRSSTLIRARAAVSCGSALLPSTLGILPLDLEVELLVTRVPLDLLLGLVDAPLHVLLVDERRGGTIVERALGLARSRRGRRLVVHHLEIGVLRLLSARLSVDRGLGRGLGRLRARGPHPGRHGGDSATDALGGVVGGPLRVLVVD